MSNGDIKRRLSRIEAVERPDPEDAHEREEERKRIREQAEHANRCRDREEHPEPIFDIDPEDAIVYSGRDGAPITSVHQTLSDPWYWDFLDDFGPDGGPRRLLHDPDTEAFYKRSPPHEMAFSRTWLPINRFFWALGDDRAHIPLKQDAAAARLSPERAEELLDDRGEGLS